MSVSLDLEIGATEAGMLSLADRGIVGPDDYPFRPYTVVRTAGSGLPKGYGYPTCDWAWQTLDQLELNKFLSFFASNSDAGVQVYITTYIDVGRSRKTGSYTAYMARPVDGEGKALYPDSQGRANQTVTIRFTHLEAL